MITAHDESRGGALSRPHHGQIQQHTTADGAAINTAALPNLHQTIE